jgi:sortase A
VTEKIMARSSAPERDVPLGVECAFDWTIPPVSRARAKTRGANGHKRPVILALVLLLGLLAWGFGQGVYLRTQTQVAQALIRHAWTRTLQGERQVKPWPWAGAWPVARLSIADRNVDVIVLASADGSRTDFGPGHVTDFGPGHVSGTALPGEKGNSVVGDRTDTYLAFLRQLVPGSLFTVQRQDGERRWYRVKSAQVLAASETWVTKQEGPTRLTLFTSYPFDPPAAGDQRYVVFASAIERAADLAPPLKPKRRAS